MARKITKKKKKSKTSKPPSLVSNRKKKAGGGRGGMGKFPRGTYGRANPNYEREVPEKKKRGEAAEFGVSLSKSLVEAGAKGLGGAFIDQGKKGIKKYFRTSSEKIADDVKRAADITRSSAHIVKDTADMGSTIAGAATLGLAGLTGLFGAAKRGLGYR